MSLDMPVAVLLLAGSAGRAAVAWPVAGWRCVEAKVDRVRLRRSRWISGPIVELGEGRRDILYAYPIRETTQCTDLFDARTRVEAANVPVRSSVSQVKLPPRPSTKKHDLDIACRFQNPNHLAICATISHRTATVQLGF